MKTVECAVCNGSGQGRYDDCRACGGNGRTALCHVPDEFLYEFRYEPGIQAELAARGCVAWVLNEHGDVMPGTPEDTRTCDVVAWATVSEAAE